MSGSLFGVAVTSPRGVVPRVAGPVAVATGLGAHRVIQNKVTTFSVLEFESSSYHLLLPKHVTPQRSKKAMQSFLTVQLCGPPKAMHPQGPVEAQTSCRTHRVEVDVRRKHTPGKKCQVAQQVNTPRGALNRE